MYHEKFLLVTACNKEKMNKTSFTLRETGLSVIMLLEVAFPGFISASIILERNNGFYAPKQNY